MKTGFVLLAGAAGAALGIAPALADTWTAAYGNTIDATYTNGNTAKIYVEPNHTYTVKLPNGTVIKGTWADANGQSCFTVTDPPPQSSAKPTCFPVKEYKVGEPYSGADSGGSFTSVIHPGR